MKAIYRIEDEGTYVDLSRITSISSVHKIEKSPYHPTIAFTITYLVEGIPFKKDNINFLTISKELPTPKEIRDKYKTVPDPGAHPNFKLMDYTEEGLAVVENYRSAETEKFEKVREALAEAWSNYRYLIQGG